MTEEDNNKKKTNYAILVNKVQKFKGRSRIYKIILSFLTLFALFVQLPFLSQQPWEIEWSLSALLRSFQVGYFFDNPSAYMFQVQDYTQEFGGLFIIFYLLVVFIFSVIVISIISFFLQILLFGLQSERFTTTNNKKLSLFETHIVGSLSKSKKTNQAARGDMIIVWKNLNKRMPHVVIDSKFQTHNKFGGLQIKFNNQDEVILEGEFLERYRMYTPEKNHKDIPYIFTPSILHQILETLEYVDIEFYEDSIFVLVPPSQTKSEEMLDETINNIEKLCDLLDESLKNKDTADDEQYLDAKASIIYYPRIGSRISIQWFLSRILLIIFLILLILGSSDLINLNSNDLGFVGMFIWWLVLYIIYVKTPNKRSYQ